MRRDAVVARDPEVELFNDTIVQILNEVENYRVYFGWNWDTKLPLEAGEGGREPNWAPQYGLVMGDERAAPFREDDIASGDSLQVPTRSIQTAADHRRTGSAVSTISDQTMFEMDESF